MGSYGVGVSRAVAVMAEQRHDALGLAWPREVAPADVHIVGTGKENQIEIATQIAEELEAKGLRVLLDDRAQVSPGVKFKDSELLGLPTRPDHRPRPRQRRGGTPRPRLGRPRRDPPGRSGGEGPGGLRLALAARPEAGRTTT